MFNPYNKVKRMGRLIGSTRFYQDPLAKAVQEHIVSLLLFALLHLIRSCAELNADELITKTTNCIDDAA